MCAQPFNSMYLSWKTPAFEVIFNECFNGWLNITASVTVLIFGVIGDLSRAELMMMTIADVIKQLVEAHEDGKDINLNK